MKKLQNIQKISKVLIKKKNKQTKENKHSVSRHKLHPLICKIICAVVAFK